MRSMADAASYTLSNGRARGNSAAGNTGSGAGLGAGGGGPRVVIQDARWKFQDEGSLPMPRQFGGGVKRYRAGRGSSVPLDLAAFE